MDIREEVVKLRSRGRVQSNIYSEDPVINLDEYVVCGDTILLSRRDHGISRLYYFTIRFDTLIEALAELQGTEYVLEFMTRASDEHCETLQNVGFTPLAHLMRLSTRDVSAVFEQPEMMQYYDEDINERPLPEESASVNSVLWNVFDTRISHLLSNEELADAIRKGQITIHKTGDKIVSILQVVTEPRKFYINQVYNSADKKIIHAMLLNRLKNYIDSGGRYAYAWVDCENVPSIKFHQKYGFSHDGMWNPVYVLRKKA